MGRNEARADFSARLNQILDESPEKVPREGRGRQGHVGKMFGVDQKAARKWLKGEGFPTLEKAIEIAKRFNVTVEWLLSGRGEKRMTDSANMELAELLDLWWKSDQESQREIITFAKFISNTRGTAQPIAAGANVVNQALPPKKTH
jgi:transcriptional regulator with XRE-family HTH domain